MIKGALVELMPAFGASVPNVVMFQFNPETLRHSWTQPQAAPSGSNPLAVQGMPGESFSFNLAMDVTDQLSLGQADPQRLDAQLRGIYSRLAALEMLLFPVKGDGGLTGGAAGSPTGAKRAVPAAQVPTVLFVWGPSRIVPVRVTSLTITEKLFDELLNPTHADAQVELRVLTPLELASISGGLKDIATGAYTYSQHAREVGALFNLTNAAGAIALPLFPGF